MLASYLPQAIDNGQVYAYLDYAFTNDINDILNNPPIAVASALPESGQVPLEVAFDGSGSSDSDGTIISYFWNFGDRIGPPGDRSGESGVSVTHTFYDPGIYSAKLTVTDNSGATSSTALTITATAGAKPMHVSSIVVTATTTGKSKYAKATVYIVDPNNQAVSGATVTGNWSGLTNDGDTGLTDNQGKVTLSSDKVSKSASGTFEFCVTDVTLTGYTYDPADNSETCDSVTTP